jgi:CheY-like chemotaxis protein
VGSIVSTFRSLRIAIADDDARIRDFLERALILLGHQVVGVAANGNELVDLCLLTRPDLILTDVHMPGANGLEAIQRIWRTVMVPAIVLTGLPDQELLAGNNVRHSALCLMKPVPLAELARAIVTAASPSPRSGEAESGKRRPAEPRRPDRRTSLEIAADRPRDDTRPGDDSRRMAGERPRVTGRRESAGGGS